MTHACRRAPVKSVTVSFGGAAGRHQVSTRQQSTLTAERVNVLPGAAGINSAAAQYVPGDDDVRTSGQSGDMQSEQELSHAETYRASTGLTVLDSQPAIDGVKTGDAAPRAE